jgi:undecaprenyl-diphosphatase
MNRFDLLILSFFNRFAHRSLFFDELVVLVSGNNFIKGALVVAVIWYLWFQNKDAPKKRECLLAGVGAGFFGLAIAKVLTWAIVRPRPLNVPQLAMRIPYGIKAVSWEGLSSFPSDHAVLFFALATGIFFASRRTGWLMFIYVSALICLPRVYLGVHYPDRHSCWRRDRSVHRLAASSSGNPKTTHQVGASIARRKAGTVLRLFVPPDLCNL